MKKSILFAAAIAAFAACDPAEPESNVVEHLEDAQPTIEYAGETYKVAKLAGQWWMAENLRFVPKGVSPCDSLTNVAAGIYYPIIVKGGAAAFSTDTADIRSRGYLYQAETAFGVAVNSIKTEVQAKSFEGAQGICPKGWHLPTIDEIVAVVGKAVSPIAINTQAPYYNGSDGSISLLNAAGANIDAYGAVSINDNTKTTATLMGFIPSYNTKISSGYIQGSSFATITTMPEDSTKIKNIQFYSLMPMTNKAKPEEYTCNGSKLSYKIAAAVRCVKDK